MHPNSIAKVSVCMLCQQKRTLWITTSRALRLCISKVPSSHVCSSRHRLLCSALINWWVSWSALLCFAKVKDATDAATKKEVKCWTWVLEWSVVQKYRQKDSCQIHVLTLEGKRIKMFYRKKYLLSLVFGVVWNLTISEYCFSGRRIFSRLKKLQQTAHPNPPSPAQNLKSMSK